MARLHERSPPIRFAIPDAWVDDGCGEVLERLSSCDHVVDLHRCPRCAAGQQRGNFQQRSVSDIVDSCLRCCGKRFCNAQQMSVRRNQLLDGGMVGPQEQAIAEKRPKTARPPRRSNSPPERSQRKHDTEPDRRSTTNGHRCRQGRRLPTDDRPKATHDKDRVDRPRPSVVCFSKNIVDQFVEVIATTLEVPESNKRTRPRRNNQGRSQVVSWSPFVHKCESMPTSSNQIAGPKRLANGGSKSDWGRSHSQPDRTPAIGPREAPYVYLTIQVLELSGVTDAYRNRA
jgi:hypothetical protein